MNIETVGEAAIDRAQTLDHMGGGILGKKQVAAPDDRPGAPSPVGGAIEDTRRSVIHRGLKTKLMRARWKILVPGLKLGRRGMTLLLNLIFPPLCVSCRACV